MKEANKTTDLKIGKTYIFEDMLLVTRAADKNGCLRCALEPKCARFSNKSEHYPYHKLCAGKYRDGGVSIYFVKVETNLEPQI
jgi:hypothetical protein